jgi:hypothetical protein
VKYLFLTGIGVFLAAVAYAWWFLVCKISGHFNWCPGLMAYITSTPKPEEIVVLGPFDEIGTIRPWRILSFIHTVKYTYADGECIKLIRSFRNNAIYAAYGEHYEWCRYSWAVERDCPDHGPMYEAASLSVERILLDRKK